MTNIWHKNHQQYRYITYKIDTIFNSFQIKYKATPMVKNQVLRQ